jgi:hypothetical protein
MPFSQTWINTEKDVEKKRLISSILSAERPLMLSGIPWYLDASSWGVQADHLA